MPSVRQVRFATAPAGAGLVALLVVAATAGGGGLLRHGTDLAAGRALVVRVGGLAAAVTALVVLTRQPGVGVRRSPAVLVTGMLVLGAVTLLTLPVSDVGWTLPGSGRVRLEPAPAPDATAPPAAPDAVAPPPPPVLRLPATGRLQVRSDELWLIVPGEGDTSLGSIDGGANALGPGVTADLQLDPNGDVHVVGADGAELAPVGPDGPALDLGDARIEDAGGGAVAETGGGTVTDTGGGASGQLEVGPPSAADQRAQDWLASASGVLLVLAVYWMVFLRGGRLRPPAERADEEETPSVAEAPVVDPAGAESGLRATLAAMLADPDPATAIVGAYAVLLAALEAVGLGRRPEEAPHEHLRRALAPVGPAAGAVHDLADLFVLARFGGSTLTGVHRDAAIRALRVALEDHLVPVAV